MNLAEELPRQLSNLPDKRRKQGRTYSHFKSTEHGDNAMFSAFNNQAVRFIIFIIRQNKCLLREDLIAS